MGSMINTQQNTRRFPLGQTVMTPGAIDALAKSGQSPVEFISQHVAGQWGEVCDNDKQANEQALKDGERLLSAYRTRLGRRVWIITEADRSVTTMLLPE